MKVHKVVLIIIDFDEVGAAGITDIIENTRYPNRCIMPRVFEVKTADIGEWNDLHPLNNVKTADDELRRIFPSLKTAA